MEQIDSSTFQKARRHLLQGFGFGVAGVTFASAAAAQSSAAPPPVTRHRVFFQVDSSDEKVIGHAISGTINLSKLYMETQQPFEIEIVANASGIQMMRADTSTVAQPIAALRSFIPNLGLSVCASAAAIAAEKEGHELSFLPGVKVVPYGIARVVELQEAGWCYIHA